MAAPNREGRLSQFDEWSFPDCGALVGPGSWILVDVGPYPDGGTFAGVGFP